jgi:hypothetical protein
MDRLAKIERRQIKLTTLFSQIFRPIYRRGASRFGVIANTERGPTVPMASVLDIGKI